MSGVSGESGVKNTGPETGTKGVAQKTDGPVNLPAKLSPLILSLVWGEIEVEESAGKVKDVKLWPGGCRSWDWGETGTRHSPGIQVADVEELIEHGATTIVLSKGMVEKLGVPQSTLDALKGRGIEVHVAETRAAMKIYNDLVEKVPVGGLFHSTC